MRARAGVTGAKPDQPTPCEMHGYGQPDWAGLGLAGGSSRTRHGQSGRARLPHSVHAPGIGRRRQMGSSTHSSLQADQRWRSAARPAGPRRLHRLARSEAEDRKCRRDLFEFRKRCVLVHGHVGSRSRCSLQVSLQEGARWSAGTSSSWISSRSPLRRTARPPAARTLLTHCTSSPSIDTNIAVHRRRP